jgi:hypothetical protein
MFKKKRKARLIVPAGIDSVTIELPWKPREIGVEFIQSKKAKGYPACNPSPTDILTCKAIVLAGSDQHAIVISWNLSGPREIEWQASARKI